MIPAAEATAFCLRDKLNEATLHLHVRRGQAAAGACNTRRGRLLTTVQTQVNFLLGVAGRNDLGTTCNVFSFGKIAVAISAEPFP
jgi:hypothetical protein